MLFTTSFSLIGNIVSSSLVRVEFIPNRNKYLFGMLQKDSEFFISLKSDISENTSVSIVVSTINIIACGFKYGYLDIYSALKIIKYLKFFILRVMNSKIFTFIY